MAYTPNPADTSQPTDDQYASTAAAEFRALKAYIAGLIPGGLAPQNGIFAKGVKKQTVISGTLDANGLPSWGSPLGTINVTFPNISTAEPLIISAVQGFNNLGINERLGLSGAPGSISCAAGNGTYYLYSDIAADGTLTFNSILSLAPIYQEGGTPSVTLNQFTFIKGTATGWLGNGVTAGKVWRTFIGEAVVAGGVITSVTPYAYNGKYNAPWTATLLAAGGSYVFNHNIGVVPKLLSVLAKCTTVDIGFAVGTEVEISAELNGATYIPTTKYATDKTLGSRITGTYQIFFINPATGSATNPTLASWQYGASADRGWAY